MKKNFKFFLFSLSYTTEQYEMLLVLALGKPKEEIVIEPIIAGKIEYWRDSNQVHHVPKRSLEELIL